MAKKKKKMVKKMLDGSIKRSKLNFGDLAGSEDVAKALGPNPDPERLKEAISINASLTALTTAISYLAKSQRPSYRSSALTHILQDSLGGNSKTTMIVNSSPHIMNRPETIRTFRFAQTAKTVKNKARVNKELTRAQMLQRIQELESENASLIAKNAELVSCLEENGLEAPTQSSSTDNNNNNNNDEKTKDKKKHYRNKKAHL
ncbi:Kinesin-related motor protein involved in mitotic spindle positioning [Reticulomyxa filosa]|uniref:Kinesin-related motor protein involved in mitotic spindle positioning n=1 Tax=Reticulomyxa filosa TaxID=46433 RepID=X6P300_RETFI|nr:Kinesin-related motor protein involved in mitotic spindle positioning [Reticulomyxa filosa]|eukprot:ETO31937.1 Kinesin-related motor protein involved in mitotic spindle positioning [Reticulomyxa filosa]